MADDKPKHEIISRKDAKFAGLKFYFTGKPCKYGHLSLRRVSETGCAQCSATKLRKWRSENREKSRAIANAWRNKNICKMQAQERERYAKNPQKFIEKQQRFYAENGEAIRERRKAYHYKIYVDPSVRAAASERTKRWALDNPERAKASAAAGRRNRIAREKKAIGTHSHEDVVAILLAQKGRCAYCRKQLKSKYDVDHIVPMAKGGSNDRSNLQITCPKCNRQKGARDPIFHARTLGLLL